MKDLHSNVGFRVSVSPAVQNASVNGAVIDRYGFESVTYAIQSGAIAGSGLFSAKIQDSDDGTTFADVEAKFLIGTQPASLAADSVVKQGYVGHKRYTRLALTKASGTSVAIGAVAVLGHAHKRPVA